MDKNFGVLAVFRSGISQLLVRRENQNDVICELSKQNHRKIEAQQNRNTRQTGAPAKNKAPITRVAMLKNLEQQ